MKRGRILHLEDDVEWIQHIQSLLDDHYDVYPVSTPEEASRLLLGLANKGLKIDFAIIDISLTFADPHEKSGFLLIKALEETSVLQGHRIIVLSGYSYIDDNLRVAFRDYDVVDVFDKGNFIEERDRFRQLIAETIERLKS
jgi:ActR/RegA family two-component response regulator